MAAKKRQPCHDTGADANDNETETTFFSSQKRDVRGIVFVVFG